VRLWRCREPFECQPYLSLRRFELAIVEERNGEVQPGGREIGALFEGTLECRDSAGVIVLLEPGDTDVVLAIGVLAGRCGRGGTGRLLRDEERGSERTGGARQHKTVHRQCP
jgi:hypothetical protein